MGNEKYKSPEIEIIEILAEQTVLRTNPDYRN